MTTIDNRNAILEGVYSDATVLVPANTTYEAYTVLGLNADGKLTAFSTANDSSTFKGEPSYILAHSITNSDATDAIEYPLARVLECGDVDIEKAVFVKAEDATNAAVLTSLKNNGIRLVHVDYAN